MFGGVDIKELKTLLSQLEAGQIKMMERFKEFGEKLGCEEDETLMEEVHELLAKEVHSLRGSLREDYTKVFTSQIKDQHVSVVLYMQPCIYTYY